MRIVYDSEFIAQIKNSSEKFVEKYWNLLVSIDDMRRKERIYAIDHYLNKKELRRLTTFFKT